MTTLIKQSRTISDAAEDNLIGSTPFDTGPAYF